MSASVTRLGARVVAAEIVGMVSLFIARPSNCRRLPARSTNVSVWLPCRTELRPVPLSEACYLNVCRDEEVFFPKTHLLLR